MTEETDAIEGDLAATQVGVTAAALVDLPQDLAGAVLADLHPAWAGLHQASEEAVLADLPEALVAVSEDLPAALAVETGKADLAR